MKKNTKDHLASILAILIATGLSLISLDGGIQYNGFPALFICMSCVFIIHWIIFIPSYILRTERYFDITGTIAYLSIIVFAVYFITVLDQSPLSQRSSIAIFLVLVWSIRLGLFLFVRVIKAGEDKRFKDVKLSFSKFFMYFNISGLWVFLTTINFLTMVLNNNPYINDIYFYLGLFIWIVGFYIEVLADEQKRRFKLNISNKDKFISSGLWKYSRHPNYFGEIVLWIGMAIMTLPTLRGWEYISLISPIFVYFLLTKSSGVPLLENQADKKWGQLPEYQEYKNITPVLFPFYNQKGS
tara:strand:+ start:103 stop:996 length:894 start_codon:yes stop_codon:yes gene_type:complete